MIWKMVQSFQLIKMLTANDFEMTTITVNSQAPGAESYRLVKWIDGVEFEVKIRDYECTLPIQKLHDKLDNDLTREEYVFWTYHKYLLKEAAKEDILLKQVYVKLKIILYNFYFIGIDGSFMFGK